MNERIKQLAEQAGLKSMPAKLTIYKNDDETYSNVWEYPLEKFAELIVRECMEVCKSRVGNSDYNTGRMHCASDLKEHFGVEE